MNPAARTSLAAAKADERVVASRPSSVGITGPRLVFVFGPVHCEWLAAENRRRWAREA